MGIGGLFIVAYLLAVRSGLLVGLGAGLAVWFVLAGLVFASGVQSLAASLLGWLALGALCTLWVESGMHIPSQGPLRLTYSAGQIAERALFGGAVIACAVLAGKLGGPSLGGIFATFPAMYLSTLAVIYRTGGVEFHAP